MNYLEKNLNQYKKDLEGLIKFDTVLYKKEEYPTQGMKDALSYMEDLAKREEMNCFIDDEGYYGYIEIGSGEEMVGLIGHIDVVEPGNYDEWKHNPFNLTIEKEKWIARGTQDMKGPVMLMFYLMKQLKEEGVILNKRIRLIFPTDEESFWRGISKYNEKEESPTFGFTPDSRFPVTFLERESIGLKVIGPSFKEGVIKGGVSINAVPAIASYKDNSGREIIETGLAAHAMNPEIGVNAIQKLVNNLKVEHPLINFIKEKIGYEVNGKTIFDKVITDEYSTQTFTIGMIEMNENSSMFTIDMRIPVTDNADSLEKIIASKAGEYGLSVERIKYHEKLLISKESKLVTTLMDSYNLVMKDNIEPIAIGGGTYARALKNIVAFGTLLPDEKDTMHQVNEYMNINNVIKAYKVFEVAIKKLIL